jgi:hypothetical protein
MMRARTDDDAGQGITALALIVALGIASAVVYVLLPLGGAAAQRATAQTAADASALAAVKEIRTQILKRWSLPLPDQAAVDDWLTCGLGQAQAQDLAARNDARVTQYCYAVSLDQAQVRVRGLTPVEGQTATASAAAELGIAWGSCTWTPDPVTPTVRLLYRCGTLDVPFLLDPATGRLTLDTPPGWLESRLVPRLVS